MLQVLAKARVLRGSVWDVFGYTFERKQERSLIDDIVKLIGEVVPQASPDNVNLIAELLSLPQSMRGFGHFKQSAVSTTLARQAWLLHRLNPSRYPWPTEVSTSQQFRGLAIASQ